jgi:hypothetical protein
MLSSTLRGLKYPLQLDGKGDLSSVTGLDLEKADMLLLLGIARGELPWDHAKGTRIRELLHSHVSSTVTARAIARREATDVVNTYAPGYVVTAADVEFRDQLVNVSVEYKERGKVVGERTVVTLEVNR